MEQRKSSLASFIGKDFLKFRYTLVLIAMITAFFGAACGNNEEPDENQPIIESLTNDEVYVDPIVTTYHPEEVEELKVRDRNQVEVRFICDPVTKAWRWKSEIFVTIETAESINIAVNEACTGFEDVEPSFPESGFAGLDNRSISLNFVPIYGDHIIEREANKTFETEDVIKHIMVQFVCKPEREWFPSMIGDYMHSILEIYLPTSDAGIHWEIWDIVQDTQLYEGEILASEVDHGPIKEACTRLDDEQFNLINKPEIAIYITIPSPM